MNHCWAKYGFSNFESTLYHPPFRRVVHPSTTLLCSLLHHQPLRTVVHPTPTLLWSTLTSSTLQEGWSILRPPFFVPPLHQPPLRRVVHPSPTLFRSTLHTHPPFPPFNPPFFKGGPLSRVDHPFWRVDWRVGRMDHP